jgi:hypothetical protein
MDPSFDTVPDIHYTCDLCGLQGEHFKTLCPDNTDPLSLNQKRRTKTGKISSRKRNSRASGTLWDRDTATRTNSRRRQQPANAESTDGRLKNDLEVFDEWEYDHKDFTPFEEQTNMTECNESYRQLSHQITSVSDILNQIQNDYDQNALAMQDGHISVILGRSENVDTSGSNTLDILSHMLSDNWAQLSSNLNVYSEFADDTSVCEETSGRSPYH